MIKKKFISDIELNKKLIGIVYQRFSFVIVESETVEHIEFAHLFLYLLIVKTIRSYFVPLDC